MRLTVFARAPLLGTVKTRIARSVGDERALELYRWLAQTVTRSVCELPRDYEVLVSFTPSENEADVRALLPWADRYEAQRDGDLGARMKHAIDRALAASDRVVVIGTDCVAVTRERVTEAFATLDRSECVLGPAHDGGYYLLATRAPSLPIFDAMPWSTDRVLRETLDRLALANISTATLAVEHDVDDVEDLPSVTHLRGGPAWIYEEKHR